jgi:hypothetical protein
MVVPRRGENMRRTKLKEHLPTKADVLLLNIQRILDAPDPDPADGLLRDAMRLSLLATEDVIMDDGDPARLRTDDRETLFDCMRAHIDRYLESAEGREIVAGGKAIQRMAMRILENMHLVIKRGA